MCNEIKHFFYSLKDFSKEDLESLNKFLEIISSSDDKVKHTKILPKVMKLIEYGVTVLKRLSQTKDLPSNKHEMWDYLKVEKKSKYS